MNASRASLRRLRRRDSVVLALAVILAVGLLGSAVAVVNPYGIRTRLHSELMMLIDPPPDRPIADTILVTPRPVESPSPTSSTVVSPVTAGGSSAPATPDVTPTPEPQRVAVDVNLLTHPANHFISEQYDHTWCAVAGTQMVLAMWGKAPLTLAFQKQLASRIGEWESRRDSRNGGWGPSAMVAALQAYGVNGYQVRAYERRADALYDAAAALEKTHAPVILLAWYGAHTWVMTGFRADADPLVFPDARVTGAYILDPWYPLISSLWGPSDPPGSFENLASMRENYLRWKRPEGSYPGRDGLFIAVVPTKPMRG